jgi:hypothetical protein
MREASESVTLLDNDWPGRELRVMPQSYLGEVPGTGPILEANPSVPHGGVLFFDDPREWVKLRGALAQSARLRLRGREHLLGRLPPVEPALVVHQITLGFP